MNYCQLSLLEFSSNIRQRFFFFRNRSKFSRFDSQKSTYSDRQARIKKETKRKGVRFDNFVLPRDQACYHSPIFLRHYFMPVNFTPPHPTCIKNLPLTFFQRTRDLFPFPRRFGVDRFNPLSPHPPSPLPLPPT